MLKNLYMSILMRFNEMSPGLRIWAGAIATGFIILVIFIGSTMADEIKETPRGTLTSIKTQIGIDLVRDQSNRLWVKDEITGDLKQFDQARPDDVTCTGFGLGYACTAKIPEK